MSGDLSSKSSLRISSKILLDSLKAFKTPKGQSSNVLPPQSDMSCTSNPSLPAQRVVKLFEEASRKASVAVLLEYIIDNLDRFAVSLGTELTQLLQQHKRILYRYKNETRTVNDFMDSQELCFMEDQLQEGQSATDASKKISFSFFDEFDEFDLGEGEGEEMDYHLPTVSPRKVREFPSSSTITCRLPVLREQILKTRSGTSITPLSGKPSGYSVGKDNANSTTVFAEPEDDGQSEAAAESNDYRKDFNQSARQMFMSQSESFKITRNSSFDVIESAAKLLVENEDKKKKNLLILPFKLNTKLFEAMQKETIFQDAVRKMCNIIGQLTESSRIIFKKFISDPSALELVQKCIQHDTIEGEFVSLMEEFREVAELRMFTTPEQQKERLQYMQDATRRDKVNKKMLNRLNRELQKMCNIQEDKEYVKKITLLEQLQMDTIQIEKFSGEAIRRHLAESEKQKMTEEKQLDEKTMDLRQEIVELTEITESTVIKNKELENELRSEKYKMENELDACIRKYDEEMIRKTEMYEYIEMNYKDEKAQLVELEEYFADLEKEYMFIMEERRAARNAVQIMRRTFRGTATAVRLIQALYRSFKVRKAIQAEAKRRAQAAKRLAAAAKNT
ncbi:dynein regulatory complex protein 10 [Biomphalaria pfeifferi]|uniref:Dynein regulatory complex protein 10 n=1 Tax=Biomphalaria pfeifferi TaxID=112525 RepID=A0AAD8BPQ2_BIOPF|nr:dynein regulatory complex protein 10 [Biomphalaria pfeifferi]